MVWVSKMQMEVISHKKTSLQADLICLLFLFKKKKSLFSLQVHTSLLQLIGDTCQSSQGLVPAQV